MYELRPWCQAAAGVDAVYVPLLVDDITEFLASPLFGGKDFAGYSVTIPHKEEALKCCKEAGPPYTSPHSLGLNLSRFVTESTPNLSLQMCLG